MQIEVTAQNIDDYGLDELTGNTKEELLARASEAARSGQILHFKVPDAVASQQKMNVFDQFKGQLSPDADPEVQSAIAHWDGKEIPAEVDVPRHTCDFPITHKINDTWTCPWCKTRYYAEAAPSTELGFTWVVQGEIVE